MERVAFLIEHSGVTIGCLLNPESLVIRRTSGLRPRQSIGGPLTLNGLSDDPLLYTGGGRTEIELGLLFDVSLAGSSITTNDVRQLTGPLWRLAENGGAANSHWQPPQLRFLWGKAWDIPCLVGAVAEKLDYFSPAGTPQRSWLSLRLLRTNEPPQTQTPRPADLPPLATWPEQFLPSNDSWPVHQTVGGERLDQLANQYYGNPALWRPIATANHLGDPLHLEAGLQLQIPSLADLKAWLTPATPRPV